MIVCKSSCKNKHTVAIIKSDINFFSPKEDVLHKFKEITMFTIVFLLLGLNVVSLSSNMVNLLIKWSCKCENTCMETSTWVVKNYFWKELVYRMKTVVSWAVKNLVLTPRGTFCTTYISFSKICAIAFKLHNFSFWHPFSPHPRLDFSHFKTHKLY